MAVYYVPRRTRRKPSRIQVFTKLALSRVVWPKCDHKHDIVWSKSSWGLATVSRHCQNNKSHPLIYFSYWQTRQRGISTFSVIIRVKQSSVPRRTVRIRRRETLICIQPLRKRSQHVNPTYRNTCCWAQHVVYVWPPCCDMLWHIGCCCFKFENGQIWASNTQHVATLGLAKRTQHVAPNNVTICCVGMLRSFGRDLGMLTFNWRTYVVQVDL